MLDQLKFEQFPFCFFDQLVLTTSAVTSLIRLFIVVAPGIKGLIGWQSGPPRARNPHLPRLNLRDLDSIADLPKCLVA